ncbi:hypothetical protein [Kitasatospora paranensis]|uniref:Uncharacterized protein n=1 Tax=Kitasatospora paranensis TaxID=258053 RepID=A0ABW2G667_9ACTN
MTFPADMARRPSGRELVDRLGFALRHGVWLAVARVPGPDRPSPLPACRPKETS